MYRAAEQWVLDHLRTLSDFDGDNSARYDFTVRQRCNPFAAAIYMAEPTIEADMIGGYGTQGNRQQRYLIAVALFSAVNTGATPIDAQVDALLGLADAVATHYRAAIPTDLALRDVQPVRIGPVERGQEEAMIQIIVTVQIDAEIAL